MGCLAEADPTLSWEACPPCVHADCANTELLNGSVFLGPAEGLLTAPPQINLLSLGELGGTQVQPGGIQANLKHLDKVLGEIPCTKGYHRYLHL